MLNSQEMNIIITMGVVYIVTSVVNEYFKPLFVHVNGIFNRNVSNSYASTISLCVGVSMLLMYLMKKHNILQENFTTAPEGLCDASVYNQYKLKTPYSVLFPNQRLSGVPVLHLRKRCHNAIIHPRDGYVNIQI